VDEELKAGEHETVVSKFVIYHPNHSYVQ